MSKLIKTEGVVLSKIKYGESSVIARIFTKEKGKISVILKGARSPKSKTGKLVNPLNLLEIIYYNKPTREIQLLSEATLIKHFNSIRADYDAMIFASAILELTDKLIHSDEPNERLFKGIVRIFDLMNSTPAFAEMFFVKFLFFFIEILGYKLTTEYCMKCNASLQNERKVAFNYEKGFLCEKCAQNEIINFSFSKEQYKKILCLTSRKIECDVGNKLLNKLITLFEKYMDFQIEEFSEINTLKLITNMEE